MDEGVFIIVALVIALGLIAGLYFVIDLLSQRVLSFASEARVREQREIVNHERLARIVNELVDELDELTKALKNERILRSHGGATGRVAAKKSLRPQGRSPRDDRATVPMPVPPEAGANEASHVLAKGDMPTLSGAPPPAPC